MVAMTQSWCRVFPVGIRAVAGRGSATAPVARRFTSLVDAGKVPGPPRLPLLGNLHNFDVGQLLGGDMRPIYAEYGPIVNINLAGTELVFLSDVNMAREVLKDRAGDFTNGDQFRNVFGSMFPTSVIVVEGSQWQRVRRILQRAVQGTRVAEVIRPMSNVIDRADKLMIRHGEPCDVHRLSANITFDTFGIWAYDVELNMVAGENADLLDACETVTEALCYRMHKMPIPFMWKMPTPLNRRLATALQVIRDHASQLLELAKKRVVQEENPRSQTNLLDALVIASMAEDDARDRLTDEEMLDNMCTIFFGAYDTTSATLAFTLHFLATHAEAQDSLAAELAGINLEDITMKQLHDLKYLDMVTKEANRLRSTAWAFPRTAKLDTKVGGYTIRKGTNVLIDHTGLSARDPTNWGNQQDLDNFRPGRWAEVKPHRLASLPFGFGARMCIGAQVATMEHKLTTASLIQKYSWHADPDRPLKITTKLGLTPNGGCWLIPEKRPQ